MFDVDVYLNSFTNWEPRLDKAGVSSFSLERMDALLKVFRHPESSLIFAHIAGSKGKGSTAAYLAYILRAAGYRTGLYTSPHLYSCRERIRILEPGIPAMDPFEGIISPLEFSQRLQYYQPDIEALRAAGVEVTYYELMTAFAAAHFAANGVKVVVLETGLGGRLDATNYFETSVCGITPIGLEHTAILGNTLMEIAAEKAAIIKSVTQRVAVAPQEVEVMSVLQARAKLTGVLPTLVGADMPVSIHEESRDGVVFSVAGRREYSYLKTRLNGVFQAYNASLAIAMAEDLEMYGLVITEESVRRGVAETSWPGRFEILPGHPTMVVDAAHTPESAEACARAFEKIFPGRKAILLLGVSMDKNIRGISEALMPIIASVVATSTSHPRAFEFSNEALKQFFPSIRAEAFPDMSSARTEAVRQAGVDGIILVAGSIFLAAQARQWKGI